MLYHLHGQVNADGREHATNGCRYRITDYQIPIQNKHCYLLKLA
jgi:hypothetical protein